MLCIDTVKKTQKITFIKLCFVCRTNLDYFTQSAFSEELYVVEVKPFFTVCKPRLDHFPNLHLVQISILFNYTRCALYAEQV